MDQVKQNLPKVAIATAIGAVTAFILYQLLRKKEGAELRTSSDPLTEVIDQRATSDLKMEEAAAFVKSYVE